MSSKYSKLKYSGNHYYKRKSNNDHGKSSYKSKRSNDNEDDSKTKHVYIKNNPDERDIDLSEIKKSSSAIGKGRVKDEPKTGQCEGCGEEDSPKRFITNEFLCMDCRSNIQFKLITKSTISNLYPSVSVMRLRQLVDAGSIDSFKTLNWHNRNAPPIQLFYEKDIMELAGEDVQQTSVKYNQRRRSRSRSTSHPKKLIIEKV